MEAALADYFDRLDRGERADISKLAALYPDCETELRRFHNHERKLRGAMVVIVPSPEDGGGGTAPRDNLAGRTLYKTNERWPHRPCVARVRKSMH